MILGKDASSTVGTAMLCRDSSPHSSLWRVHRTLVKNGRHAAFYGPGVALWGGGVTVEIENENFALPHDPTGKRVPDMRPPSEL
jgi:hypothetical protein